MDVARKSRRCIDALYRSTASTRQEYSPISEPLRFAVITMVRSCGLYLPLSEMDPDFDEIEPESVWRLPSGSMLMVAVEVH